MLARNGGLSTRLIETQLLRSDGWTTIFFCSVLHNVYARVRQEGGIEEEEEEEEEED